MTDDSFDPATKVGLIECAWPERWSVRAVFRLDPDAHRLEAALRRMYVDRTLRLLLAFSIVGRIHHDEDRVVTPLALLQVDPYG